MKTLKSTTDSGRLLDVDVAHNMNTTYLQIREPGKEDAARIIVNRDELLESLTTETETEIDTAEALRALPHYSIIIDSRAYVFRLGRSDVWWVMRPAPSESYPMLPVTVLRRGEG